MNPKSSTEAVPAAVDEIAADAAAVAAEAVIVAAAETADTAATVGISPGKKQTR